MSERANYDAQRALDARKKARIEKREQDAQQNDLVFKSFIAMAQTQSGIAERFNENAENLRREAGRLQHDLLFMSIQLQIDGAQAEQAKADLTIANATEVVNRFAGGTSKDGVNGSARTQLKQLTDGAFLKRRTQQHVLNIRKSTGGALASSNETNGYQVVFPQQIEEAARAFEEKYLLTAPTEPYEEQVESSETTHENNPE